MGKVDEALLKRIADHQMLHGSFRRDLGVLNAKWELYCSFSIMPVIRGVYFMRTLPGKCWRK